MNILSKNTRLLLLATLLCLHALAVPAMGEDGGTRKKTSAHRLEKSGRPDGGEPTMVRSERRERLKREEGREFLGYARDRQGNPERKDRDRTEPGPAGRREGSRQFGKPGGIVKHAERDAVKPSADFRQRDAGLKTAPIHRAAERPDSGRENRVAKPRKENALRQGPTPSHQSDARIERVRRPQYESRGHGQIRENGHFSQVRHDRRPVAVKHVVHKIPERHTVVVYGKDRYHYYLGRFYRPWDNGFILVRPPLGLIVLNIPLGSRMVISAGITYHVFGDVYYRRVPAGYQVVEPIHRPAAAWPDRIVVAIDLLNLRYGPQIGEEVIAQVERYATLRVLGSAPGWLYVEVEGEDLRGWVMERYVASGNALG